MKENQPKTMWRLQQLLAAVKRQRTNRRAVSLLQEMDDHMLNDIGIGRGDIERMVNGGRQVHMF